MPSISETIRALRTVPPSSLTDAVRGAFPTAGPGTAQPAASRLQRLSSFGSNPGALNGWCYVPDVADPLPLVVVLHGCTQNAGGYDYGSGWSDLAERFGFAVLFPEQQRVNNSNLCFNWFVEADIRRDSGEALSIRQMIAALAERHSIDAERVFVTGLSAGGAMANVMLATYPELFAGGSIIAGLPYGTASSVPQALDRMRGAGHASFEDYAAHVCGASTYEGPWPKITVWHGDADRTVVHTNAEAILGQWRGVHGVKDAPDLIEMVDGHQHRVWAGMDHAITIEEYRIAGLGHGTPLKTTGADSCGNAGAHMLEAGISSTWHQAQRWGLINDTRSDVVATPSTGAARTADAPDTATDTGLAAGVNATIERALRSAGLMR